MELNFNSSHGHASTQPRHAVQLQKQAWPFCNSTLICQLSNCLLAWPSAYPDSLCKRGGTNSQPLTFFSSLWTFLSAKLLGIKHTGPLYSACILYRWQSLAREVRVTQLLTKSSWSESQHSTPVYCVGKGSYQLINQESRRSLSGGWKERTKVETSRKEEEITSPFHSVPPWTEKQEHHPDADPKERTWTHSSSPLLCWVCSKPCHMVYNRREVGWPIESDLRQDVAIGIDYALDPCNTRKASCLAVSPVTI